MKSWVVLPWLFIACGGDDTTTANPDSSDTPPSITDTPVEDLDEDGWTGDEGDCDDQDADNDCEGTVDEDATDATEYYLDADSDQWGEVASSTWACELPEGHAESAGDCDDSSPDISPDGIEIRDDLDQDCDDAVDEGPELTWYVDGDAAVSPAETELCNDWADNDCDGTDNGCTPTGSLALVDSAAVITPASSDSNGGSQMGWRVDGGGDVDGDGKDEAVCGARRDASGGGSGAAWVYSDPSDSLVTTDAYGQLVSSTGSRKLGNGVALGDLDGDGYDDLIVSAPGTNTTLIWFGPLASATPAPDATLTGASASSFGTAVASGHVNGDGIDDVVVGALTHSDSAGSTDSAFVFLGPIAGDVDYTAADTTLEGEVSGNQAGGEVAVGDDLLGNGGATILVGAKAYSSSAGRVYVVDGSSTGTVALASADAIFTDTNNGEDLWDSHDAGDLDEDGQADLIVTGQASADKFGYAAAGAGDFNGDAYGYGYGYDHLIVGAYGDESPAHNSGSAYVIYGPVASGTVGAADADVQLGGAEDDQAGLSVADGFDANGDGYDDVIVGSWKDDTTYTDAGACYVVLGGGV